MNMFRIMFGHFWMIIRKKIIRILPKVFCLQWNFFVSCFLDIWTDRFCKKRLVQSNKIRWICRCFDFWCKEIEYSIESRECFFFIKQLINWLEHIFDWISPLFYWINNIFHSFRQYNLQVIKFLSQYLVELNQMCFQDIMSQRWFQNDLSSLYAWKIIRIMAI